ncbi:hypothetical protein P378_12855 [Desulforamulus profundi]|uniref:Uncharacterized protein n=1 Tax=Desulforamulus profundi TaxID=1383067 RepID=A0A2C6MF41_9FIRM|nr:hypothetical protein P378_12855 [Desulforamulus profundi]
MQRVSIPKAEFAVIGSSSTFSISFPEDINHPEIKVLES